MSSTRLLPIVTSVILIGGVAGCPADPNPSLTTAQFCERACAPFARCFPDDAVGCVGECIQAFAGTGQACTTAYEFALDCFESATCQQLDEELCDPYLDVVVTECGGSGNCDANELSCSNGDCIPASEQCDGGCDCTDCGDEVGCSGCDANQYTCDNGTCIPSSAACDESCDCGGCEDEDGCTSTLTTAQAAVGAWYGTASCGGTTLEDGYILCPAGRLRGFETLGGWDFICCGTWNTSGSNVHLDYTATAVADPTFTDHFQSDFTYDAVSDVLIWVSSGCNLVLQRLQGPAGEDDCNTGSCSAGGTGTVQCNTDCDCGRCWYCESDTCRYGGEGPYGCYRGCS